MPDKEQAGIGAPAGAGLRKVVDDSRDLAAGVGAAGRDAALHLADQYKTSAADRVEDAAGLIGAAAGTAERIGPPAARTVREAEAIVRGTADALRRKTPAELFDDLTRFARRQPTVFLGGSIFLGLAAARFLKSSADRRASAGPGTRSAGASHGRAAQRPSAAPHASH